MINQSTSFSSAGLPTREVSLAVSGSPFARSIVVLSRVHGCPLSPFVEIARGNCGVRSSLSVLGEEWNCKLEEVQRTWSDLAKHLSTTASAAPDLLFFFLVLEGCVVSYEAPKLYARPDNGLGSDVLHRGRVGLSFLIAQPSECSRSLSLSLFL